jgi:dienelactone hydrolase
MIVGLKRAVSFARTWRGGATRVGEVEMEIERGDRTIPATLLRPRWVRGPLPVWVVLHGITRPGRHHPTLTRFVRALAGSGLAVLVPEIPEWRELYLAPDEAGATIRASVLRLGEMGGVHSHRVGIMGFSLGVPQVLLSATDPVLQGRLQAVAGFGGYGDLDRAIRFLFQGEHEWDGVPHRVDPDPYGRWVVGGNYLTRIPGLEDADDVAQALLELARQAGDLQVGAWEACYDTVKEKLLERIDPGRKELFRAFAPPTGHHPPEDVSTRLAPLLAQAARASAPQAEPRSFLHRIRVPVRLVHGTGDRLIPFSESLRLASSFPEGVDVRVYLTGLFSHSQADTAPGRGNRVGEQLHFLRILADLLNLV